MLTATAVTTSTPGLDECGVCNGPRIYECGADDASTPSVWRPCSPMLTDDGICDDVDPVSSTRLVSAMETARPTPMAAFVTTSTLADICRTRAIYECGCDCDGNQLDALGVCGGDCAADADSDGICDDVDPCVGELDAIGVCNGDCTADADNDGICDDVDPCVGTVDACGVCNGPGAVFECGCSGIPAGDCDCDGNQLDAIGICGGTCTADADGDGVCDDVDPCVGTVDACGICNGPGAIYECGCADIPAGDCDCDGNQLDALGVCGGTCTSDVDGDGVCDNDEVAGCTDAAACNYNPDATDNNGTCQYLDACGVCGGPEIYECGCANIPEGIVTATETRWTPSASVVEVVLLTQTETGCVMTWTPAWAPSTPAACVWIYECGCADIPAGDCDCNGNQTDALGVCVPPTRMRTASATTSTTASVRWTPSASATACAADADADGICDDVDDCVGTVDACGICNGPGAIYDCGAPTSRPAIVIATATNSTPSACAAVTVPPMRMPTASATMWTTASARWTLAACATVQAPS